MENKNPNIYLIGLGAIGCALAAQAQNNGCRISIICNENRKKRYKAEPFIINKQEYNFDYVTEKMNNEIDILLIGVKFHHLPLALEEVKPFVTENTTIISLLNGINSEEIIQSTLKNERIVHAFVVGTDSTKFGTKVNFTKNGKIVLGSPILEKEKMVKDAASCLQRAGLNVEISDRILRDMWWKLMVNVGINQIAALHKIPYGVFNKNEHIKEMTSMAMSEVVQIAQVLKIDLSKEDIDQVLILTEVWGEHSKASMLQDVENKRKTEVEMFAGEICRLGETNDVPTPINRFLFHAIKFIEKEYLL